MTLDLTRVVTTAERNEIAADGLGTTWDADEITVGEVIAGMAGLGYGGHFDECSDEEHAVHDILARHNVGASADWERLDAEISAIHDARNRYANLVRDAADAVVWPADDSRAEPLRKALVKCARRVYMDSNDWEITRLQEALDEALALIPFDIDQAKIDAEALAWAEAKGLA